ncbi:MAG: hypothetical protein AAFR74_06555, partial [Pseudomonadota bacterium]
MKTTTTFKLAILASAAALALTGCSDTNISSPGAPTTPTVPTPPPPPPPPTTATIDLVPAAGCPTGTTETTYAAVAADGFSDVDVCAMTGTITSNITIPANTTVALEGPVFIGEDTGGGAGTAVTLTVNGNDYTGTVDAAGIFSIDVPGTDLAADPDITVDGSVATMDAA